MATQKITTSKGSLEWVTINGEGKENLSGRLQYVANLVLDPDNNEADAACVAKIHDFWKENKPAKLKKDAKSLGLYPHKVKASEPDEDGDAVYEETGKVVLSFKTATTYPNGNPKVIQVYNAKAQLVTLNNTSIGNGSIGQISGAMGIYEVKDNKGNLIDAGVTLYLDKIKLSKLVEFEQASGFDADEDIDEDTFVGDEGWTGSEAGESSAETSGPRL